VARPGETLATIIDEILHLEGEARCPEVSVEVQAVLDAHADLGKDPNGSAYLSEMRLLWRREGVTDAGVQDAQRRIWRAIESERNAIESERIAAIQQRNQ
jgi:hypothetical protein